MLVRLRAAALNHRDLGIFDWEPDAHFVLLADGDWDSIIQAAYLGLVYPGISQRQIEWALNDVGDRH